MAKKVATKKKPSRFRGEFRSSSVLHVGRDKLAPSKRRAEQKRLADMSPERRAKEKAKKK